MFIGMSLRTVPPGVVLALCDAVSMSNVNDFWTNWSRSAEAGLFGERIVGLVVPRMLAALRSLEEVCYVLSWRLGG